MKVVRETAAFVKIRATYTIATVVGVIGVALTTVAVAPGEEPGYRRLVELESTRTYADDLAAMLAARDERTAARAALALGRTRDVRAAGLLKNATGARNVSLRALAVYGYGLLSATRSVSSEPVASALHDPASVVRVAAADAAWRQRAAKVPGADRDSATLLTLLASDRDPIVRARAATALVAWTDAPDPELIAARLARAFTAESDSQVRWHEAWVLRRGFASVTPLPALRAGVSDPDELVRVQFADLIARRRSTSGLRYLQPLLHDPSWHVREQADESIRVLRGGTRTEHLTQIPAEVIIPGPEPDNTEPALPRDGDAGRAARKPTPAEAILDVPLLPTTSAQMTGPLPGPHPRVRIGTTKGTIVVRLTPEWAPLTVANFLNLADRGYYDGLRWFRIVPNFVIQSGDKTETGDGDAGYAIPAEENPQEQQTGVISMGLNYTQGKTSSPIRDSAGTQFYITLSPQLHLNRDFTVFGHVESGFATLGRLVESDHITRVERLSDR